MHLVRSGLFADDGVLRDLLEALIRANGENGPRVWSGGDARVAARLEHVLANAVPGLDVPLVHRAVNAARGEALVVQAPDDGLDPVIVALELRHKLERVRRVDLNVIPIGHSEAVAAIGERTFAAVLDREFLERPDVVHQKVKEPELVDEAHEHVQARWVHRDAHWHLGEVLEHLKRVGLVVPDPERAVLAARGRERLTGGEADTGDGLMVKRLRKQVEAVGVVPGLGVVGVDVLKREVVDLVLVRSDHQPLLGRAYPHALDHLVAVGVGGGLLLPSLLEQLFLVDRLKHVERALGAGTGKSV